MSLARRWHRLIEVNNANKILYFSERSKYIYFKDFTASWNAVIESRIQHLRVVSCPAGK